MRRAHTTSPGMAWRPAKTQAPKMDRRQGEARVVTLETLRPTVEKRGDEVETV
ncbi:MAG: hypothetical protein ACLFTT_16495 [Candidatus Hydrogenedentota bacterium]